jgi:chromosome partitioning protein
MRAIAVVNQKGGVGKTTTAVNLGHALALRGHKVMLVDLDPQSQLSTCLGIFRPPSRGVDESLLGEAPLDAHAVATRELIDLVPAGGRLAEVEGLQGGPERGRRLAEAIARTPADVDYVLFDCPPSAGLLMANAILAADVALVPVAGDYLSLTGLAGLMMTLQRFQAARATRLETRLFLSRFLPRRRLSVEVRGKLLQHFPGILLATAIREAAVLAECASVGRTVFEYRPGSKSAAEFRGLGRDLLEGRLLRDEQEKATDVA